MEITRLEAVANDERNLPGTSVEGEPVSNDELRHYIMTGDTRSLSTLVQADGGYTVIPELDKEIMRQLQDDSVMRSIATVKTTKTNEYQKLVSVGGAAVKHGAEGEARAETTTPRMERVDIKLSPIYAYPKTTQEILDFSEVDVLGWLSSEISDTFSATEENDFVNGDGVKKAKGFLAYDRVATGDKTRPFGTLEKMETTAVNSDGLIDLLYKLKAKYRKNAVWVMNSNTAATLQKLKTITGTISGAIVWSLTLLIRCWAVRFSIWKLCPMQLREKHFWRLATLSVVTSLSITPLACAPVLTISPNRVSTRCIPINTGGGVVDSCAIKVLELSGSGS